MNKKLIVIVGLGVLVASLAVAGVAMAQTPTPPAPGIAPGGRSYGMMGGGYGYGMMGGRGRGGGFGMMGDGTGYGPMHDAMFNALAEKIGVSREELDTRVAAGETPWQIAAAEGISQADFAALMVEARTEAIQQAVKDGTLTQEQADWMLNHVGGRGGFGPGNCPHLNGAQTAPTTNS